MSQILSADHACREALQKVLAEFRRFEGKTAFGNTSAYCQARRRLGDKYLADIHAAVTTHLERLTKKGHLWFGRVVKIVDGSSVSMPDTPENQQAYPQSSEQKPGCGFPFMRLAVIFSLATGAILDLAWGSLHIGEGDLFHRMWDDLSRGDVVLADRGFCGYADIWCLLKRGVDTVMRMRSNRTKGLVEVRRLNARDRIVDWIKTDVCPGWMDYKLWLSMPDRFRLREIRYRVDMPGCRSRLVIVVTTLMDNKRYPTEAFIELYRRRWMAELILRDVKTTMGMDVLRCKSPDMVEKELRMFLIAHNLLRVLMFEAAMKRGVQPYEISFKGALSITRQWAPMLAEIRSKAERNRMAREMLRQMGEYRVADRPGRVEPRAVKRRPKEYPLLNKPRSVMKEKFLAEGV